ncbi:ras guanine nucleotide exchange factor domain-containing protein [Mycotypha africana]|uniref:ras guanine nucleotide exchange factor domain-containing protein n=1 Tax=Mycotypha africana TaxID=64632 RepID=UPI002300DC62|nr:ras guanine nucleotide exchange factor domain-containing protein [Mycotypha africana]KAI8967027.1 ras guanine nucleotide exchange factor domain-containing protein [Mycotypha africana]
MNSTPSSSSRSSMVTGKSALEDKRPSLPINWVMQQGEDGSVCYYINTKTGEMRSSFPYDDASMSVYDGQSSSGSDGENEDEEEPLTVLDSTDKDTFYQIYSNAHHRHQRDHRSSSCSSVSSFTNETDQKNVSDKQQQGKWIQRTTPQGLPFFYNLTTNETAWHADAKGRYSPSLLPLTGELVRPNQINSSADTTSSSISSSTTDNHDQCKSDEDDKDRVDITSPMSTFSPIDIDSRHCHQQQLTWNKLLTHITSIIHQLTTAVKNSHSSLYQNYADRVVNAIRFMLFASGTISKESMHFRCNNVLRSHHRAMMASMTKLVLAAQLSSNNKRFVQPSSTNYANMDIASDTMAGAAIRTDDSSTGVSSSLEVSKLLQGCHELTTAVRNYVSTCENIPVELHSVDPTFVLTGLNDEEDRAWDYILKRRKDSISSGASTIFTSVSGGAGANGFIGNAFQNASNSNNIDVGGLRSKYELEPNLLENLETYGASMQESIEPLMANLTRQSDSRCSLAVLLFTHYRNFGNQNGQFLSIIEDIDFEDVLHLPAMKAFNEAKQQLYDGLGILFFKMQAMTDESTPLLEAIKDIQRVSTTIIDAIKMVCDWITELVDERSRILEARKKDTQQQQANQDERRTRPYENRQSLLVDADDMMEAYKENYGEKEEEDPSSFTHFIRSAVGMDESLNLDFKLPPLMDKQPSYNGCKRSKSVTSDLQQQQQGQTKTNVNRASAPASNRNSFSDTAERPSLVSIPTVHKNTPAKLKQFFGDDLPTEASMSSLTAAGPTVAAHPELLQNMRRKLSVTPTSTKSGLSATEYFLSGEKSKMQDNTNRDVWYLQHDYEANEIVFTVDGNVKGGTLKALVERLTMHDYLDMNFNSTFLLTYRSFCTSLELLSLLEARYNIQPPEGFTPDELEVWTNRKQKLIRLRVFNVLKSWLEQYYYEEDSVLLDRLLFFTNTSIKDSLRFSAVQLERLIHKRKEACTDLKKLVVTQQQDMPEPILPRDLQKFRLLDVDPLEMARQLTLMDFKLFSSIKPVECLDKAWSRDASAVAAAANVDFQTVDSTGKEKENKKGTSTQQPPVPSTVQTQPTAVNIRASIDYCNRVTTWVSDAILSQPEVKKRSAIIKYWVNVAERCRLFNNFNTCMAILSAFDNSAIGRLKRTWELVGARTNHVLSHIRKLMGANRNFNQYRAIIHSVNPPCIPFLGIYLQDLTFIEDGNPNLLKTSKDLINFAKRAKTAEVIREIQQYQTIGYYLRTVPEIQQFIVASLQSARDEEVLYKESLKIEPKERDDEKITRLLQESGFL